MVFFCFSTENTLYYLLAYFKIVIFNFFIKIENNSASGVYNVCVNKMIKKIIIAWICINAILFATLYSNKRSSIEKHGWVIILVGCIIYNHAILALLLIIGCNRKQLKENRKDMNNNDVVLGSIFPEHVIDIVKNRSDGFVENINQVTIIFCDIVNFTSWSKHSDPKQIYNILNVVYGKFDDLAIKYDVYKVETVGDSYMAVSGYPENDKNSVHNGYLFAQAILDSLNSLNKEIKKFAESFEINVRIGMHTGTVTTGIIGKIKPHLNFVGDVVNTAARMEQNSGKNKIHVTKEVANILSKHGCYCESRGYIDIKGKGSMNTFFVYKNRKNKPKSPHMPELLNINENVFSYSDNNIVHSIVDMFVEFGLHRIIAYRLVKTIRAEYKDVPYHNFLHAYCVTQMCYTVIHKTNLKTKLSIEDKLILLLSCVAHDIGHEGCTAHYQHQQKTQLYLDYGAYSTLEKFHYYKLYQIIDALIINATINDYDDVDIHDLEKAKCLFSKPYIKEIIRTLILSTDMTKHDAIYQKCENAHKSKINWLDRDDRILFMRLVIKLCDVSNELRPRPIALQWLVLLEEEFCMQLDREYEFGLDLSNTLLNVVKNRKQSQIFFLEKYVIPLIDLFCENIDGQFILNKSKSSLKYWKTEYKESDVDNIECILINPNKKQNKKQHKRSVSQIQYHHESPAFTQKIIHNIGKRKRTKSGGNSISFVV